MSITAKRYHDFCAGHRVVGHEGKCRHLHGHNYRVHFEIMADHVQDDLGRVLDFSVIKSKLCEWLEENWDHKFIYWTADTLISNLVIDCKAYDTPISREADENMLEGSFVEVDFNPTAENLAKHLVEVVAPKQLEGLGCTLIKCEIEETRKCSATFYKDSI